MENRNGENRVWLTARQWAMAMQIMRYGFVGVGVTAVQAAIYWLLSAKAGWHPQLANFIGYLFAVTTGYVAHGAVTFRGHAATGSALHRIMRFVAASLVSFALNAFWVWLMTGLLRLPLWTPIPFMAAVTPGLVFVINRQWVFR
jgi:putative flippase GtrA